MSSADSIKVTLTTEWQNLWVLADAKRTADGLPSFNKHCRTLNLEAPSANGGTVFWARTSIGDNPAGELGAGDSILKQTGGLLNNENLYTLYAKGSVNGLELYIERTQ